MKINLTKKDLEVCLHARYYFVEAPDRLSPLGYKKEYQQWQKTREKIWKALNEMEKGK